MVSFGEDLDLHNNLICLVTSSNDQWRITTEAK